MKSFFALLLVALAGSAFGFTTQSSFLPKNVASSGRSESSLFMAMERTYIMVCV